ncbi:MAG: EF-hand domain-containing protein [Bacteroidia bacterium]|nr:EF-hand domain-containing protein [Bacteroidia bacterium]
MSRKNDILKKIRILLTEKFETPEEAFRFFDENDSGTLSRSELKKLVHEAEISGFLSTIVARQLIKKLDEDGDGELNWHEFKGEFDKLLEANLE